MPSRAIRLLSLAYAAAPVLLFVLGYLRLAFALPVAAVVGFALYRLARAEAPSPPLADASIAREAAIAVIVLVFAVAAGFGGFTAQDGDYVKHNALFKDLMELSWPLAYAETGSDGKPRILNIYMGYYLPAALVGKVLGTRAGFAFSFAWAALGMWLALQWVFAVLQRRGLWIALLFLSFGGLDLIGHLIVHGRWPGAEPTTTFANWMHAVSGGMNGVFWIFPPNLAALVNGPHHVLPSWVALLMLMHDTLRRDDAGRALFLWSTTTVVSSFFAIGMLPFVACALLGRRLRSILTFENTVAAGTIALVAALYLVSNDGQFTRGFLWDYVSPFKAFSYLALFYLTSIGLYLLFWPAPLGEPWRGLGLWLRVAIACVLVFPFYRIGHYMDFPIKALLPSVIVFLTAFATALCLAWERGGWPAARPAIVLAAVGAFTAATVLAWAGYHGVGLEFYRSGIAQVKRMDEIGRLPGGAQLFSNGDSVFWRHIGAKPRFQPRDEAGQAGAAPARAGALDARPSALLHERWEEGVAGPGRDTGRRLALPPGGFTVELVFVPSERQRAPWAALVSNEAMSGGGFAVQQSSDANNRYYVGVAGRTAAALTTPVAIEGGKLHHLAFGYAPGRIETFLDGRSVAVDRVPAQFQPLDSPVTVRVANREAGDRPFSGRIFELRVWAGTIDERQAEEAWSRVAGSR